MTNGIDIVIPTVGRPEQAHHLAVNVAKQLHDTDRIFIICQDTPQPRFADIPKQVQIIYSACANLPRARNIGSHAGINPVILFLDDDVVIDTGLLDAHRTAYTSNTIGAIAGYIDDPVFDRTISLPSQFDERTGELIQQFMQHSDCDTISFMGAHFSVRRTALASIHGFDERYTGNALWEDVDCAFRLARAGWHIRYRAQARVTHTRAVSGGCRSTHAHRYLFRQFANTAYFGCRFAQKKHLLTWLTFWYYRLEYLSRRKGFTRHSCFLAGTGIIGAIWGIALAVLSTGRIKNSIAKGNPL
jgi:GT2 family glycosyltransferase